MINISSELSKLSYDCWKVNTIVETALLAMVKGVVGVRVSLGPVLLPVQNGVAPNPALSRIRLLSFPT